VDAAEAIPTGLAEAFYTALATVHYEGSIVVEEAEPSASLRPGSLVNVTAGETAWAAMNALIQSVSITIGTGTSTIRIGPPSHLSINDMVEFLRANRRRRIPRNHALRVSGLTADSALSVSLGSQHPRDDASAGRGALRRLVIADGYGKVRIAPDDITDSGTTLVLVKRTFVSDVRVNTTAKQVEKKTWTGWIIATGTESDWTKIDDGDMVDCSA
jgi:hypothetical protein